MKVMVVGAGKLGYRLAESMLNTSVDVTLIDTNARVIDRINDHLDVLTVMANGIELEVLKELNIDTYDLLIACTGSDETNVLICTLAKKLGCRRTIARIRNPEYTKQISFIKAEMGIDHIVNPDLATANEISRYILRSYNLYSEDFAKGRVSMIEFNVSHVKGFVGRQLRELNGLDQLLIVAVAREGEMLIPHGQTELQENDIVHVIGASKRINSFSGQLGLNQGSKRVKKVIIFGGGKVGLYLAQQLRLANVAITIVEKDKERCQYLSERLDDVLIIHGDGTDINLLEEENLQLMDAFVGATGFDEQNLLMCLLAKQAGVGKVIAKISRPGYAQVIDKLGIDVALNPTNITASDILRFIRGGRVVSVSLLLGGEAEVTEIIVGDNPAIIGKPLAELGLPKGIIIGAIVHGGQVIIPNGATVIHALDRLIIFCLTENVGALNVFMKPSPRGGMLRELRSRSKNVGGSFKA